jgi:hypothetical protein
MCRYAFNDDWLVGWRRQTRISGRQLAPQNPGAAVDQRRHQADLAKPDLLDAREERRAIGVVQRVIQQIAANAEGVAVAGLG